MSRTICPHKRIPSRRRRTGFTLMEVMLVLVILVILASFSVGMFSSYQGMATERAAKSQIGMFKTPLEMYYQIMNEYPTTNQGLNALVSPPSDASFPEKWKEPLMESIPQDPWGNPYQYESPGVQNPNKYDIWSFGPDGLNNTDDDVGNWEN